jgi:hypothetical protein
MELLSVPAIIALVEAFKAAGLPKRFAPVVAVALGAAFGLMFVDVSLTGFGMGVILGLTASGLYSGARASMKV